MIIYNIKGLIVGVLIIVIFFILFSLGLNVGLSLILAAFFGLFLSLKLTQKEDGFFNRPSIFFIPTSIYSGIILVFGIILFIASPSLMDNWSNDKRIKLLEKDMYILDSLKISGNHELSSNMQQYTNKVVVPQLKPRNFHYRILENIADKKILVLIKSTVFEELSKEQKTIFLEYIEAHISSNADYRQKEVFVGIKGDYSLESTISRKGKKVSGNTYYFDLLPYYSEKALTNNDLP